MILLHMHQTHRMPKCYFLANILCRYLCGEQHCKLKDSKNNCLIKACDDYLELYVCKWPQDTLIEWQ